MVKMGGEVMGTSSTYTELKADLHSIDKYEGDLKNTMPLQPVKNKIKWVLLLYLIFFHLGSVYGVYLVFASAKIYTTIFGFSLFVASDIGITAGVHRLWSHKTYKAKWPLRFILMIMYTLAFQYSIYHWSIDHRIHHKYSDTSSDPYNSKRGFFFSHIGWLVVNKHPDYYEKRRKLDVNDLKNDPIVAFQKKYYYQLVVLICFCIPTAIPVYFWGETYLNSFFVASILRFVFMLHVTCLVNSVAHIWGNRPFDASIYPANNLYVAIATFGEGWHNYHHVFPWDYKAAELGNYKVNLTTAFIDFFALIGWAYDLKTVSAEMIQKRAKRTGDGTYNNANEIWGWDDSNICSEDRKLTIILNRKDD